MFILQSILYWAPFRIDALGLVTILGAESMNVAVGTLLYSPATEWLPILGGYIFGNNSFTDPQPGFVLYNVTDGIMATDVSAWFTRWLLRHPTTYSSTVIRLRTDGAEISAGERAFGWMLGCITMLPILSLSAAIGDWWGFANVAAMMVSVAVRQRMVSCLRNSIDHNVDSFALDPGEIVKVFLTMPNGKAVTIIAPRQAVVNCLLTDPKPRQPRWYLVLRGLGWAAFGIHVVTLGMATLFSQLLTVVVLLAGSVATGIGLGARPHMLGKKLRLEVEQGDPSWHRSKTYARLQLTETEEDYMVHWSLFPQRKNQFWWDKYRRNEAAIRAELAAGSSDLMEEKEKSSTVKPTFSI
ncbi:hypothetical protein QBC47DRAFT_385142 [Echria macrotheca]|uniref:Uncharacterized protein n=1 Tax=Echria macrotheca TaxID=438768 RepID=A0AAJ0FA80_9PEZI|nr:hypothetical protein QBC47DRAFT_385142 [Echria macrotheca]